MAAPTVEEGGQGRTVRVARRGRLNGARCEVGGGGGGARSAGAVSQRRGGAGGSESNVAAPAGGEAGARSSVAAAAAGSEALTALRIRSMRSSCFAYSAS